VRLPLEQRDSLIRSWRHEHNRSYLLDVSYSVSSKRRKACPSSGNRGSTASSGNPMTFNRFMKKSTPAGTVTGAGTAAMRSATSVVENARAGTILRTHSMMRQVKGLQWIAYTACYRSSRLSIRLVQFLKQVCLPEYISAGRETRNGNSGYAGKTDRLTGEIEVPDPGPG
jgi:hypothetical protein